MRRAALFYGAAQLVTQKVKHMISSTSSRLLNISPQERFAKERAATWAMDDAPAADSKERAVLIYLALYVDMEYKILFPGAPAIAQTVHLSTRSIQRALSALLERGVVAKDFQYIRLGVGIEMLPAPERKRRITYIGRGDHGLSKKSRLAILDRDGHACLKCSATDDLTVDHIYPWSLGGSNDPENLRTLCRPCNSSKGNKIEVWA